MASTYTLNNGIELIGTGEQSGTWGDTTNTNLSLLDTALDGQVTVTLASAGTSGSPNTLPISDGAASDGRNRMVIFNDGGDLGATAYVQLTPNDAEKIIYIRNDLAGSRSIILFQGTYNASNDYEVPAGTTAIIYFDGAGSGAVAANVFNNAYFDSLRLGSVSVTAILDEDNMASDSATSLATQQSIKAYVDSQVTAQDLDFGGDSGTGAVDLDSQSLTIAGTANEIETSASGQTLTVGLPDNVTIAGDLTVDTDTLYVDSTNNFVGVGTTSPSGTFTVKDAPAKIHLTNDTNTGTAEVTFRTTAGSNRGFMSYDFDNDDMAFRTGGSGTAMTIDSSQRVLIGTDTARSTAGHTAHLQVEGSGSFSEATVSIVGNENNSNGAYLNFGSSRGTTAGSNTIVQDGDVSGQIQFTAADGTDMVSRVAAITAKVDGAPGANDTPGLLDFSTTLDGASDPTLRMRIDSSGNVGILNTAASTIASANSRPGLVVGSGSGNNGVTVYSGSTSNSSLFFADGTTSTSTYIGQINYDHNADAMSFATTATEAMRIDSSQRVLINTANVAVGSSTEANVQIATATGITLALRSTATAVGPAAVLALGRQNGSGIVSDNDHVGDIRFASHDGNDLTHESGKIRVSVEGTPGVDDVPGRLGFYTTADGANTSTERMRISSTGFVKIGSAGDPETMLQVQYGNIAKGTILIGANYDGVGMNNNTVKAGALHHPHYTSDTYPNGFRMLAGYSDSANNLVQIGGGSNSVKAATQIRFYTGTSITASTNFEAMRIDSSQRVLIGTTSARTDFSGNGANFQVEGVGLAGSTMAVTRNSNDPYGSVLYMNKSRGTSDGAVTIVQDDDTVGEMIWHGADGTQFTRLAQIEGQVDGTPGVNDMPGRITFNTTADGASTTTERMRIDSTGRTFVGDVSSISQATTNSVFEAHGGSVVFGTSAESSNQGFRTFVRFFQINNSSGLPTSANLQLLGMTAEFYCKITIVGVNPYAGTNAFTYINESTGYAGGNFSVISANEYGNGTGISFGTATLVNPSGTDYRINIPWTSTSDAYRFVATAEIIGISNQNNPRFAYS